MISIKEMRKHFFCICMREFDIIQLVIKSRFEKCVKDDVAFYHCDFFEYQTLLYKPFKPEFCDLKPEIGPCKWKWTRYFYNASIDDCSPFEYGG